MKGIRYRTPLRLITKEPSEPHGIAVAYVDATAVAVQIGDTPNYMYFGDTYPERGIVDPATSGSTCDG